MGAQLLAFAAGNQTLRSLGARHIWLMCSRRCQHLSQKSIWNAHTFGCTQGLVGDHVDMHSFFGWGTIGSRIKLSQFSGCKRFCCYFL